MPKIDKGYNRLESGLVKMRKGYSRPECGFAKMRKACAGLSTALRSFFHVVAERKRESWSFQAKKCANFAAFVAEQQIESLVISGEEMR